MRTQRIAMGLVVATGLWQSGCATTAPSPERRLAAVLMSQRAMETSRPPEFFVRFWEAVYRGL